MMVIAVEGQPVNYRTLPPYHQRPRSSPQHRLFLFQSFSLKAVDAWVAVHLAPGSHVVSDGLGCFKAVGQAGHYRTAIITGGGPTSVRIPEFMWVKTIFGNVKNSLRGTFHAISEKHFHRYSAEFCYRFNRRFDLRELIPRFCFIALRTQLFPAHILKVAEFHA